MSGAIYMAAAGALSCERRLEVLANNLANLNTVGFKKDNCHFQVFEMSEKPGQAEAQPLGSHRDQAHAFWMRVQTRTDFSEGILKNTGSTFDLALRGQGFFCVQTPEGVQYTRRGDFTLDSQGVLVTPEGFPVLGRNGKIEIQGPAPAVDEAGNISMDGEPVDQLQLVSFADPRVLEKVGETRFATSDPEIASVAAEEVKVRQGYLEYSNVDAVSMMTDMIEVLRGYESYQKVIRSIDEVTAKVINEVGRPA
ncbi:MAG: flagellar basal-body rod protein FlgF [Desulfobacterales bacterium]|nr:MAG: flagellar basal-body rod protein FlgF [Desulfobacterales bacterium]